MTTEVALRITDLGKMYRIGASRGYHPTLRDAIVQGIRRPFERLVHPGVSASRSQVLWALRHLDMEVNQGDTLGIIGRNGAGKSTLLKVLSHITEPTEGRVEIRGRVGSLLEVGTGFHPELTGRENIMLNGAILGMSRVEIKSKFDEIVEFSEISRFLDTQVKRYSSGMYVRLAFSVAAHLDPEILVVDEVLAVGDVAFQRKCLGKMEDVAGLGRTVLFVSHNMQAVRTLCRQAVELSAGQVINSGDAASVVSAYLDRLAESGASITWPPGEGPGDKKLRLRGMHILDRAGQLTNIVDTTEPATVRIEFDLADVLADAVVGFELVNGDGVTVLVSLNTDTEHGNWPKVTKGYNALECRLPAGLLNAGRYLARPRYALYGVTYLARPEESVSFEAHVSHVRSPYAHLPRAGVTVPVLQWMTSQTEKVSQ
jgi:lipopolysaccharide transport system ATP-binding protein